MIIGIHHLAIATRDLETASLYYQTVAGLVEIAPNYSALLSPFQAMPAHNGGPAQTSRLLSGSNFFLELFDARSTSSHAISDPPPINKPGLRHFCIQNHDCTQLEDKIKGAGGMLIADPLDLGTGNQYAYARDAEGNIMEIEGLPYAPPDLPTWTGHIAMVTRSLDGQIAFFEGLLGQPIRNRAKVGPGPQFDRMGGLEGAILEGAWLPAGNILLEMWEFHAPQYSGSVVATELEDAGFSHLAFETDNIAEDIKRIEALGGSVEKLAYENSAVTGAFARDPEGNILELVQFTDPASPITLSALADPNVCARIEAGK